VLILPRHFNISSKSTFFRLFTRCLHILKFCSLESFNKAPLSVSIAVQEPTGATQKIDSTPIVFFLLPAVLVLLCSSVSALDFVSSVLAIGGTPQISIRILLAKKHEVSFYTLAKTHYVHSQQYFL